MEALGLYTADDKKKVKKAITGVMKFFGKNFAKNFASMMLDEAKTGESAEPVRALDDPDQAEASTEVRKEGWLTKEGAVRKSWKKRFFRVQGDYSLTYSENEKSKKVKGRLVLLGYKVKDFDGKENTIKLYHKDPYKRVWLLQCDTADEVKDWKAMLKQCVKNAPSPMSKDPMRRRAFQKTYLDMFPAYKKPRPTVFVCAGSEPEMITSFAMRELAKVLKVIEKRLANYSKIPEGMKAKFFVGVKKGVYVAVSTASAGAWTGANTALDASQSKIADKLKDLTGPVKAFDAKVDSVVNDKILPKIQPVLDKTVIPLLDKVLPFIVKPITTAGTNTIDAYVQLMDEQGPDGYNKLKTAEQTKLLAKTMENVSEPVGPMMDSIKETTDRLTQLASMAAQAEALASGGVKDEDGGDGGGDGGGDAAPADAAADAGGDAGGDAKDGADEEAADDAGDPEAPGVSITGFGDHVSDNFSSVLRNSMYTTAVSDKGDPKLTGPKLCHDVLVSSNDLYNEFLMLCLEPIFVGEIGEKLAEFVQPIQDMIPEMIADYLPSIPDTITNVLKQLLTKIVETAVERACESSNKQIMEHFAKCKYGSAVALPKTLGGTQEFAKGEKKEKKERKEGFVDKSQWDADETAAECTACKAKFTFMKRRHHCRACGHVFCADCSPKVKLNEDTQRVCNSCCAKLKVSDSQKAEGKAASGKKRVVIMVKRAGDVEAEPVAVEIERGRGQTVANFKSAAASKLGLDGASSAELLFVDPNNPKFNDNDAKLVEALDGFDEEDNVLEVMTKADQKKLEADIASQTKATVIGADSPKGGADSMK